MLKLFRGVPISTVGLLTTKYNAAKEASPEVNRDALPNTNSDSRVQSVSEVYMRISH